MTKFEVDLIDTTVKETDHFPCEVNIKSIYKCKQDVCNEEQMECTCYEKIMWGPTEGEAFRKKSPK